MVDIIIITYNAREYLKKCLQSIKRYKIGLKYLITVVDNNSNDGTGDYLKSYNKNEINVIINKTNMGFCGGANIALRNTRNKFIAFLDDDAEVTKGWLDKLYRQIKNRPGVGIVGCKILFPDKRIFCANVLVATKMVKSITYNEIDKGQRDYIREADAVVGTCWLMRRELIGKIGYFDERFFPCQQEDTDYCLRTRVAGYKIIYSGNVKIIHHHLYRDKGQFEKNWQKLLKKWKNLSIFPLNDSHPVDKYIAKGINYLEKKKFNQALIELKKAESVDKRFSEPLYMAMALRGLNKYNDAIQQFKKVLRVNPSNFPARYYLGLIYKKTGQVKEARAEAAKTFSFISSHKEFLS